MIELTPDNYQQELSRFLFDDSVLSSIGLDYVGQDQAGQVTVTVQCRRTSSVSGEEWGLLKINLENVHQVFAFFKLNVDHRILSDGISVIPHNGKFYLVLNSSGRRVDEIEDLKYADVYFFGDAIYLDQAF